MIGQGVRIAMVAGEASGDLLASHLIAALKTRLPTARFYGIGGPKMDGQGFESGFPLEKLAVRGYAEVLRHYREISGIRNTLKKRLLAEPPDIFIGVDAPDFNLGLERALKQHGIPAVHYVSPSIWAWRGRRIHKIDAAVSHILALFPFEPALYEKEGIPVSYVGHPLADVLPLEDGRENTRTLLELSPQRPVLPYSQEAGSRSCSSWPIPSLARQWRSAAGSRMHCFWFPWPTRETRLQFEEALYRCHARELPVRMLFGHAHEAMMAADVVLVASGTATLETLCSSDRWSLPTRWHR